MLMKKNKATRALAAAQAAADNLEPGTKIQGPGQNLCPGFFVLFILILGSWFLIMGS